MDHETYLLRLPATDWDVQIAREINGYLATVELDDDRNQPTAFVDNLQSKWLGVHVAPLQAYAEPRRDQIIAECVRIWAKTTLGPAEPTSRR